MKEKILYVDDESINLEMFKIVFSNNFTIYTALSAKSALEILDNTEIGIIISDYKMPIMNGLEFIEKVKEKDPFKICILLSAYSQYDIFQKPSHVDLVFSYIQKPWDKNDLKNILENAINVLKA